MAESALIMTVPCRLGPSFGPSFALVETDYNQRRFPDVFAEPAKMVSSAPEYCFVGRSDETGDETQIQSPPAGIDAADRRSRFSGRGQK